MKLIYLWILTICLTAASTTAAQDGLPDDAGKDLVERMCVGCHGVETVTAARMSETLWAITVDNMVARGAVGTDEEIDTVIDYLTRHFGADANAASVRTEETRFTGVVRAVSEPNPPETEWRTYSHSSSSQRFSPLTEISPYNVSRLKLAWSYSMMPSTEAGEAEAGPHSEDNQAPPPPRHSAQAR